MPLYGPDAWTSCSNSQRLSRNGPLHSPNQRRSGGSWWKSWVATLISSFFNLLSLLLTNCAHLPCAFTADEGGGASGGPGSYYGRRYDYGMFSVCRVWLHKLVAAWACAAAVDTGQPALLCPDMLWFIDWQLPVLNGIYVYGDASYCKADNSKCLTESLSFRPKIHIGLRSIYNLESIQRIRMPT